MKIKISAVMICIAVLCMSVFAGCGKTEKSGATLSNGTLTLYGDITKEMVWEYRDNSEVKNIVAAEGSELPEDCSALFCLYRNAESIDLSKADSSKVKNMKDMFSTCSAATTINVSGFDTSKVENMNDMFQSCEKLTELDLSSFDTGNVKDMGSMFQTCCELKTIYISDKWDTDKVTDSMFMFDYCKKLSGSKSFDENKIDKEYANKDGYLTLK